jgi:exosortase/archaeosortase family protein
LPEYNLAILAFQTWLLNHILGTTAFLVQALSSITVLHNADSLYYNGAYCMQITENCLGIKLLYVYAMLIVAFPGGKFLHKLWYIPMGWLIIHLLNIIRMVVLSFIVVNTDMFDFVHGFVFRILFYGTTFILWYIWIRKFVKGDMAEKLTVFKKSQTEHP